jgi:hypothetical protein
VEDHRTRKSTVRQRWQSTGELPEDVFPVLHKPDRAINPIAIVATVDPDGAPRTAPFGSLRAVTPKLLRLACGHANDTYGNLRRDGRVMVAFLAPPNVAVGIRGKARFVKEKMDADQRLAVVEISIEEVKNDMVFRGAVESGVVVSFPESITRRYLTLVDEVEGL